METLLVTGSGGLIGSEAVQYFSQKGFNVIGLDNNQREVFFGASGSVQSTIDELTKSFENYKHFEIDVRDFKSLEKIFLENEIHYILHAAAQPSHDLAAKIPFEDFYTNAVGTLNILECMRTHAPKAAFVFMSTNKVYGDAPNNFRLREGRSRFDFDEINETGGLSSRGITEFCTIDQSMHSLFGASKLSADVLVQEYGRYFDMNTCVLRGGCLTGASHKAVKLHGYLQYLVSTVARGETYTIIGYKGKQVRDQIHSSDVVSAVEMYFNHPVKYLVANIGGGKSNSISINETLDILKENFGLKYKINNLDQPRAGDHICYYTDTSRLEKYYPSWKKKYDVNDIISEILDNL